MKSTHTTIMIEIYLRKKKLKTNTDTQEKIPPALVKLTASLKTETKIEF